MNAFEAFLVVLAVLLIVSAAFENWAWRWWTRLCRGDAAARRGVGRLR